MDTTLPAVHRVRLLQPLRGPKEIRVWSYNKHEGGATFQTRELLWWLRALGKPADDQSS